MAHPLNYPTVPPVPDECDIAGGTSPDCNGNGVPDECDVVGGTSPDCNGNGVPDECQPDSDGDGRIDACDNCPGYPGNACDVNCDGSVNGFDVEWFIELLLPAPPTPCSPCSADTNADGSINGFDIQAFIACLGG